MKILLFLLALVVIVGFALAIVTRRMARRVEAAFPPQGRFIDLPGTRLHLREFGDAGKPALLLIHGLGGQMGHFTYGVAQRLADEFRVVVIDRPGSGYSERADDGPVRIGAQADTVAALIDALALDRPVVVGHSLGGAIALALAWQYPGKVRALALIAPLIFLPKEASPAFAALAVTSPGMRRFVGATLAVPATLLRSKAVLDIVFGPEPVPADYPTRGGGLLSLRPSQFVSASADFCAIGEALAPLQTHWAELALPVSVLYGRQDRILDYRANGEELLRQRPATRLELVDGGHMLPLTQPDATAQFVRASARAAQLV
jgi:pimeloyl-ACP methyl ester carboxylesterase